MAWWLTMRVDLYRINQTTIEGKCPELLQNLLEVRALVCSTSAPSLVRQRCAQDAPEAHRASGAQGSAERDYERLPTSRLPRTCWLPVLKVVIRWW